MDILLLIGFIFFLLFAFGIFSKKLSSYSISGPMVFTAFGLLLHATGLTDRIDIEGEILELIGQIALIAILFTDASNVTIKEFYESYKIPMRLLFIGLPITMIIGALVAPTLFTDIDIILLVMMALILSPTDAALGQAVVQSHEVPKNIREAINVESGLNDGLALPPILICIALLMDPAGGTTSFEEQNVFLFIFGQIVYAIIIGSLLGWGGSKIINWSAKRDLATPLFLSISAVAISIVAYVSSEHFGGNGYIAAFLSGLFFNVDSKKLMDSGQEFGEFLSQPLSLFVFFIFGSVVIPAYYHSFSFQMVLYAVLSLTVIRIIPVIFSLRGTNLTLKEKLFIGWFGPRGIASILYLLLAYNSLPKSPEHETIFGTIVLTVSLSIFLHGFTAVPFSNNLAKKRG